MPFPDSWVERLHTRLALRYGDAFARQYDGLDLAAVRTDWAVVLDGSEARPEALHWALDNLPTDRPPNATQFRDLVRRAPRAHPAIEPPRGAKPTHEQMERLQAAVATLSNLGRVGAQHDAASVAERLRTFEARTGRRLSAAQRAVLEQCEQTLRVRELTQPIDTRELSQSADQHGAIEQTEVA